MGEVYVTVVQKQTKAAVGGGKFWERNPVSHRKQGLKENPLQALFFLYNFFQYRFDFMRAYL
jgi:hypothetical protein